MRLGGFPYESTNIKYRYNFAQGVMTLKYDSEHAPLVCMQTKSACYKGTKPMTVKGI